MLRQKLKNGLLVGLIVGVVGAVLSYSRPSFLAGLEWETYDIRARAAADPSDADPRIVMVDVDDGDLAWVRRQASMDVIDWPWPRELFAWTARYLLDAGAKAVVFDFIFEDKLPYGAEDVERFGKALGSAPRTAVGLQLTRFKTRSQREGRWAADLGPAPDCAKAREIAYKLKWWQTRVFLVPVSGGGCRIWAGGEPSRADLERDLERLRSRDVFADRIGAAPAMRKLTSEELSHELTARRVALERAALELANPGRVEAPEYPYMRPPLIPIALGAKKLGTVTQRSDEDGIFRHYAVVARHQGRLLPSLALASAMLLHPEQKVTQERGRIRFGPHLLPRGDGGRVAIRFHGSGNAYSRVGIRHVLDVVVQKEQARSYRSQRADLIRKLEDRIRDDERLPVQIRQSLITLWKELKSDGCEVSPARHESLVLLSDLSKQHSWHTLLVQRAAEALASFPGIPEECRQKAAQTLGSIKTLRKRFNSNPRRVKESLRAARDLAYPKGCAQEARKAVARIEAIMSEKKAAPKRALAAYENWRRIVSSPRCQPAIGDTLRRELLSSDRKNPGRFRGHPGVEPGNPRGRIFMIHAAAAGLRDVKPSPMDPHHLGGEITASFLDNLLHGDFIQRSPPWASALTALLLSLLLGVGTFLIIAMTRSAGWVAVLSLLISVLVTGSYGLLAYWFYRSAGLWADVIAPTTSGLLAWAAALATNFYQEGKSRRFVQDALGRYTSPELVRELMSNPKALSLDWGEKRELTVFFSDLAGFTSISERLEPEDLVHLLNEYLTEMTDIILEEDGIVDKYIGDAIMAFWGAPNADPDHALKACRATLRMQRRMAELRPRWARDYGEEIVARCGLNSGLAVAGNMGSRHKFNYTLMGDTVNLASRLEGANKPYGTLVMIGESTFRMVEEQTVCRELDLLAVKGKDRPVRVFELMGLRGEVDERATGLAGRFNEALDVYRQTKFEEAIPLFQKIIDDYDGDGPSRLYISRCRDYLRNPPPLDWDGVYRMTTK